jgi:hypothetical protein
MSALTSTIVRSEKKEDSNRFDVGGGVVVVDQDGEWVVIF